MSRNQYLSEHFNEWLDRYAPPRFIANNPDAMQQEADTLLGIVGRYAPSVGYAEWLDEVLRRLTENMTARTWPAGGEVTKACRENAKSSTGPKAEVSFDPAEMAARRMSAGDTVSEGWVYGVGACELAARGLVDHETMSRYRSAAFYARKELYSHDAALAWEAEAKERHEAGKELWRSKSEKRQRRDVSSHIRSAAHA